MYAYFFCGGGGGGGGTLGPFGVADSITGTSGCLLNLICNKSFIGIPPFLFYRNILTNYYSKNNLCLYNIEPIGSFSFENKKHSTSVQFYSLCY